MPIPAPRNVTVKSTANVGQAETFYPLANDMLWVESNLTLYKYKNTISPRNGFTILNSMLGGNHKWVGIAGAFSNYINAKQMYDAIVLEGGTVGIDCDYTDIQEAIDDNRKTIFIRRGTYTYGGNLTLDTKDNVSLIGEDRDLTIIQGDDNCDFALYVISCNNLRVENLTFTFTGITTTRGAVTYFEGDCSDVRIWNCRFKGDSPNGTAGFIERGIWPEGGNKLRWNITECIFEQLNYSGITVYGTSMEIFLITYNKFINCNGNFGIDTFRGCHYFLVAFNHFENLKSPVGSISGALFFNGAGGGAVNWNHSVICNIFKDCPLGVQFDHNCHDILVQGNQFYNGQVHIRFCGTDNTGHHVSNNYNANGSTANIQIDWATLDATSIFYIGGNFGNHPWRTVGQPKQPGYLPTWTPWVADPGAQFMVNDDHEVVLRGVVQGAGGVIFVLPASYRPSYDIQFPVVTGTFVIGIICVRPNGNVDLLAGDPLMVDLGTIKFRLGSV